ncbi:hypothetical protein D3C76_1810710 [compost metagenome]
MEKLNEISETERRGATVGGGERFGVGFAYHYLVGDRRHHCRRWRIGDKIQLYGGETGR